MAVSTLVERAQHGDTHWVTATRSVRCSLRSAVRRLVGYDERTPGPSARPELPGARVVIIVQTTTPIILSAESGSDPVRPQAFVAGLGPGTTLTAHEGHQQGVQLDLDPGHARRVLGVPLCELAGRTVDLGDLLRPDEAGFVDHVANLDGWDARTAAIEAWAARRFDRGRRPDARIAGALQMIGRAHGGVDIGAVQAKTGLSRPHLVRLFREHVGVAPKLFARLTRFEQLQARIPGASSWAALAADLGFTDQAHLAREVRAMAGRTPTALAELMNTSFAGSLQTGS